MIIRPALELPCVVPVFPLPDTVFFPDTSLDLHVFEPRYRTMVEDVSRADGLISVALIDLPDFYSVGTVGRIQHMERLSDGRFNIRLLGLERARFIELPSDRPYRLVQAEPRPEVPFDPEDPSIERAKLQLLASHDYLVRELNDESTRSIVIDPEVPFEMAVNAICSSLPFGAKLRQRLLEEDDPVQRHRRVSGQLERLLGRVLRTKHRRRELQPGLELN